jgi:hypothetical protein
MSLLMHKLIWGIEVENSYYCFLNFFYYDLNLYILMFTFFYSYFFPTSARNKYACKWSEFGKNRSTSQCEVTVNQVKNKLTALIVNYLFVTFRVSGIYSCVKSDSFTAVKFVMTVMIDETLFLFVSSMLCFFIFIWIIYYLNFQTM